MQLEIQFTLGLNTVYYVVVLHKPADLQNEKSKYDMSYISLQYSLHCSATYVYLGNLIFFLLFVSFCLVDLRVEFSKCLRAKEQPSVSNFPLLNHVIT
jgi:hypothetical protein